MIDWFKDTDNLIKLIVGGVILIFVVDTLLPEPDINKITLCRVDDNISAYTLIVMDGSDPIVGEYADKIETIIKNVARNMPHYGKVSIHNIVDGQKRLAILAESEDTESKNLNFRCSPLPPSDCTSIHELYKDCGEPKRNHDKKYMAPLMTTVTTFLRAKRRSGSSLLIQQLVNISNLSDFQEAENRSIHVFSDMLQNDSKYSHINEQVSDNEFEKRKNTLKKAKLEGVSVHVHYLINKKFEDFQTPAHQKFWKEWLEYGGAATVSLSIINLPGEEPTPPSNTAASKSKQKSDSSSESAEPKPQSASPPPSNSSPEQQESSVAPSAEDGAREYPERVASSVDEALSELLDLHLQKKLIDPESKDHVKKISDNMLNDARFSPETRGKVGELMLEGAGGFPKDIKRAYLLMRCAWRHNEKIRTLELQLDVNDIESSENDLLEMKGKGLCN